MKLTLSAFIIAGFCIACGNSETVTSSDGKTTATVNVSEARDATQDMQKRMDELKKLTPLPIDKMKALLPEELAGMKRTSSEASSAMQLAIATAEYEKEDGSKIIVTVTDCAGETGASFYSVNYWTRMNAQTQSEDQYTKTIDFKGGKAVESYQKAANEYIIMFIADERLMVAVKGVNTGLDVVKQAAESLNLQVK